MPGPAVCRQSRTRNAERVANDQQGGEMLRTQNIRRSHILIYILAAESGEIVRRGIGQSTKRCTLVVEAERYHKDKDGLKVIDHDDDSKFEILIRIPSSCCSSVA
jgi:hypothetical protein